MRMPQQICQNAVHDTYTVDSACAVRLIFYVMMNHRPSVTPFSIQTLQAATVIVVTMSVHQTYQTMPLQVSLTCI